MTLEARGLTKRYDAHRTAAVDVFDLTVADGEIVALVGESGAGKSTVGRMLAGVTAPTTGDVLVDGRVLPSQRTRADQRLVQLVTQNPRTAMNRSRSVGSALAQALRVHGLARGAASVAVRVKPVLDAVALDPALLERRPAACSGGQLARVVLARALALEPRFVVLDEPTSSLDASTTAQVVDLLRRLGATTGVGMVLITHDLAVARRLAGRVAVMRDGAVVEAGPTSQVLETPEHPYVRELVESVAITAVGAPPLRLRSSHRPSGG
jgi:peptide/nickel transport system ATP-binding protein